MVPVPWLSEVGTKGVVIRYRLYPRWVQSQFPDCSRGASGQIMTSRRRQRPGTGTITSRFSGAVRPEMSPDEYAAGNAQRHVEDRGTC